MTRGVACLALFALGACQREERNFTDDSRTAASAVTISRLQPGVPRPEVTVHSKYDQSAFAISEGQRLYRWMNCVGCHSHGGGGIGPPLMDAEWIYGSQPENVFATIVQGRPNGMPSFQGRLTDQQVWQLVAYVRSLSGLTPMLARPSREDDIRGGVLSLLKAEKPRELTIPPPSQP